MFLSEVHYFSFFRDAKTSSVLLLQMCGSREKHAHMINRLVHLYKYFQSRVIILQQHVSATSVNIIRVAYSKNTINKQINVR
jgi:hypothetical protein